MKILQVITSLRIGGAERLITELVPRLTAKGHTVDVALFDGAETDFKRQLQRTGCTIFSLGNSMYSPLHILRLRRLMKHYDVVHTHNSSAQLYAALANVGQNARLITTEHNTDNRRRHLKVFRPADRWMYRQYEKIICVSHQVETNLRAYLPQLAPTQVTTIYNGINVAAFQQATADPTLRTTNRTVLIMVSAFRPQKDHATLLRALALLPAEQYELWLVGDGDCRPQVEALVGELGLTNRVRFFGNRGDVATLLHTADIIVQSSHYEGFGLSALEAMAVGKPFVASDVNGLHEVVGGAGVLFPHEDARQLAEIIVTLSPQKRLAVSAPQSAAAQASSLITAERSGAASNGSGTTAETSDATTLAEPAASVVKACLARAKQFDIENMAAQYAQIYAAGPTPEGGGQRENKDQKHGR